MTGNGRLLRLDGSRGGGHALRVALGAAAVTGRGFVMRDVRAARDRPGVQSQHQIVVQAVAEICGARVEGNDLHASEVRFEPTALAPGDYSFDAGTISSAVLLMQSVALPLVFADGPSTIVIDGATHVPFAPVASFIEDAWVPALHRFGIDIAIRSIRPGFYPREKGRIEIALGGGGATRRFEQMDRGELTGVFARSITGALPFHVVERQLDRVVSELSARGVAVVGGTETHLTEAPGTVVQLRAEFTEPTTAVFAALGMKGERAEEVAGRAVRELIGFLDGTGTTELRTSDQLLFPLAASTHGGAYVAPRWSAHIRAALDVLDLFFPDRLRIVQGPDGLRVSADACDA